MTTVVKNLLARKETLLARLGTTDDAGQREKLEQQLKQIDTALDFLDKPAPAGK